MADLAINNIEDLKAEIVRLRLAKAEQGKAIARRFNSPMTALTTIYSIFPREEGVEDKNSIFHQDFFGLLSRILLPLTLNKTLFRNSNFLVKGLVSLVSQKASHLINEDSIMGIWDKVKGIFDKKEKHDDYGIPPESEAS